MGEQLVSFNISHSLFQKMRFTCRYSKTVSYFASFPISICFSESFHLISFTTSIFSIFHEHLHSKDITNFIFIIFLESTKLKIVWMRIFQTTRLNHTMTFFKLTDSYKFSDIYTSHDNCLGHLLII